MKRISSLVILGLIAIILFSCKKNEADVTPSLAGKWKLVEVFDGSLNGGSFTWETVSTENSHELTFTLAGAYSRQDNLNGNFQLCSGTYTRNNNDIQVMTNCNSVALPYTITELSVTQLILDRSTPEGKRRYKYVSVG